MTRDRDSDPVIANPWRWQGCADDTRTGMVRSLPVRHRSGLPRDPTTAWLASERGEQWCERYYSGLGRKGMSKRALRQRRPSQPHAIAQATVRQRLALAYAGRMPLRVVPLGIEGIDATGAAVELSERQRARIGQATRLALSGDALRAWLAINALTADTHRALALSDHDAATVGMVLVILAYQRTMVA